MKIQFENENENKRPFKNCTEKSIKITKIEMEIQLENGNSI